LRSQAERIAGWWRKIRRSISVLMVLAVVCMAIAFMESFGGERTQELSDVVHVSDGLSMIGFSEHYDEPYIDSPVIKTDFDGQVYEKTQTVYNTKDSSDI